MESGRRCWCSSGRLDDRERILERDEELVAVLLGQAVRGLHTHDVALWSAFADQHSVIAQLSVQTHHELGVVGEVVTGIDELNAEHESTPTNLGNRGVVIADIRQTLKKLDPALEDVLPQEFDFVNGGDHGRTRKRVAAEGVEVQPSLERLADLRSGRNRSHWEAVGDPLGHDHDVGRLVPPLAVEPLAARAAEACLHLVGDEESAVAMRELNELIVVPCRAADDPAIALDRFDPDPGEVHRSTVRMADDILGLDETPVVEGVLVHALGAPQRVGVGREVDVVHVGRSVPSGRLEGELGSSRSAAVVSVHEGDQAGPAGRAHHDPGREFVRLRAGVGEVGLGKTLGSDDGE